MNFKKTETLQSTDTEKKKKKIEKKKKKIFSTDFVSKCGQVHTKLRIWSHLLRKFVIENFILSAVRIILFQHTILTYYLDKLLHVYCYHTYFFLRDFKICLSQEQHSFLFNVLAGLDFIYMEMSKHTYRASRGCWKQFDSVPWD